jgi:hypothetical protein
MGKNFDGTFFYVEWYLFIMFFFNYMFNSTLTNDMYLLVEKLLD